MGCIQSRQRKQYSLFREVQGAWSEEDELLASPEKPILRKEAIEICAEVALKLASCGVPYCASPDTARESICENCRTVSVSDFARNTDAVARFCACAAHLFGYKQAFTVILALAPQRKILAFDRPLTRNDVNSGVTLKDERMVIIFRDDADFFKTLLHELIHLMGNEMDEARTEFGAILIHCMMKTHTFAEYEALLKAQQQRSSVLSDAVQATDAGNTNENAYGVVANVMLQNPEESLTVRKVPVLQASRQKKRRDKKQVSFTVLEPAKI